MQRPSAAAAIAFLLLALAGCFPRGVEVIRTAGETTKPRSILVAHWGEGDRFGELLDRYTPTDAGVRLRTLTIPKERYTIELTMLMLTGSGPDVFALPEESVAAYARNGWLLDLDAAIQGRSQELDSLPAEPGARPLGSEAAYYLPYAVETSRLLYSRSAFRDSGLDPGSPPRTIGELLASARRIGQAMGQVARAFAFPLAEGIDAFREVLEPSAARSGQSHFRPDPLAYDLSIYEPWLRLLHTMELEELLLPGWRTLTKRGALENLLRGNVAMLVATSSDYAYLAANRPASLDIGVAAVPALREPAGAGAARVGFGFVVSSRSAAAAECVRVWEYLYSPRTQEYLLESGLAIPASTRSWRRSAAPTAESFSFDAFLPSAGESLRFSPQNLYDSPILLEAYRASLESDPERIPEILETAADACRRRLLPRWGTAAF